VWRARETLRARTAGEDDFAPWHRAPTNLTVAAVAEKLAAGPAAA
jgi:hypothetical protein